MKPDKAIQLLNNLQDFSPIKNAPYTNAAVKLGAEALKRLLRMRSYNIGQALLPLPGENPIPDLSPSADRKKRIRESPLGRK